MRIATTLLAMALVAGCASGYSAFYNQLPWATPENVADLRATPPSEAGPLVDRSATLPDPNLYGSYGYVAIGYSSFTSGQVESESGAIRQAKAVGADLVVIVNPAFVGSHTSHVPVTRPTTDTTFTSGSATAYSQAGSVTAYGTSTTTIYGTETTYIPLTVNRYEFGAVYFIKRKYVFGANWRDLNESERRATQSNRGIYIQSVVVDTPAFNADVLAGDIVTHIAGHRVSGSESANELIALNKGKEVEIVLIRDGETSRKTVQLLD